MWAQKSGLVLGWTLYTLATGTYDCRSIDASMASMMPYLVSRAAVGSSRAETKETAYQDRFPDQGP